MSRLELGTPVAFATDFFDVVHTDHQSGWLEANGLKRVGPFKLASERLDCGEISYDEYLRQYGQPVGLSAEEMAAEFAKFSRPNEPMVDLIQHIHDEGTPTVLISNSNSGEIRPIIDEWGYDALFDQIVVSGEVGVAKPDHSIFRHAAKLLGVTPDMCTFTDDNPKNVLAAREVGMVGLPPYDANRHEEYVTQIQATGIVDLVPAYV